MLSFINMGGRKRRRRSNKSRTATSAGLGTAGAGTGTKRLSPGSFASPGDVGVSSGKYDAVHPLGVCEVREGVAGLAEGGAKAGAGEDGRRLPVQVHYASQRSPEIQLELKHHLLLTSLPEEFLRHGKGSMASSVDDIVLAKPLYSNQITDSTSTLDVSPRDRRLMCEKSCRAPLPTITPIHIPTSPLQSVPVKPTSQQRGSRAWRRSSSCAWASDSELDPVSAVSGMSTARDVLAKSFSFSTRASVFGYAAAEASSGHAKGDSEKGDRDNGKDMGHKMMRQDSATLPRDLNWESALTQQTPVPAVSMKRRKRDAAAADLLPPAETFTRRHVQEASAATTENDPGTGMGKEALEERPPVPPRKDSIFRARLRNAAHVHVSPPPLSATPGAQTLGYVQQASLHRISRITEGDAEAGNPPLSGSSSASSPSRYSKYDGGSSPHTSPSPGTSAGKRSAPQSAASRSDYGYGECKSFLDDFQPASPIPAASSALPARRRRGEWSGVSVPATEKASTMSGPTSASAYGSTSALASGSPGFQGASTRTASISKAGAGRALQLASPRSEAPASAVSRTSGYKSAHNSPPGAAREKGHSYRSGNDSSPSIASYVNNSPSTSSRNKAIPLKVIAAKNNLPTNKAGGPIPITRFPIVDRPTITVQDVQPPWPGTPDSQKRRPSLPQLYVNNATLSPVAASISLAPLPSSRSPDLLDMLIPNGHIVAPIALVHPRPSHKREGSTPSLIRIVNAPRRYAPLNGDDADQEAEQELGGGDAGACDTTPSTGEYARSQQTFPETPVLLSPDFPAIERNAEEAKTPTVTLLTKSPPISPLQPPLTIQIPSENGLPPPPILAPAPRRNNVHERSRPPPPPFGPRKPNFLSVVTPPLSFRPRCKAASEGSAGTPRVIDGLGGAKPGRQEPEERGRTMSTTLDTPTFKTTPVEWRGLTLDAAKWTSAQLQDIVRCAIKQSAQTSSIRLLPQNVLDGELPAALERLEVRRTDVQDQYKVLMRRRRALVQRLRLVALPPGDDATSVAHLAEELGEVAAACDARTEELHDVCEQIAQIRRLGDVHLASALAMALRKVHRSLVRCTAEKRALQAEAADLRAEREEAWKTAGEVARALDAVRGGAGRSAESPLQSVQGSSLRSSRVSVSVARIGSARTSRAGLRGCGCGSSCRRSHRLSGSSLHVNPRRTTARVVSDGIVVPPARSVDSEAAASLQHQQQTPGLPSASESDGLYHAVYDLLGVGGQDRGIPSPSHSAVFCSSSPRTEAELGLGLGLGHVCRSDTALPLRAVYVGDR